MAIKYKSEHRHKKLRSMIEKFKHTQLRKCHKDNKRNCLTSLSKVRKLS